MRVGLSPIRREGRPASDRLCREGQALTTKKTREAGASKKLLACREASRVNITSEEGILLRVNRSIQVEGTFRVAKADGQFRRFMTRGKPG